tara:strand:- start:4031 stop:4165 length:135 start_codon:yes stop_codon:yes gene_type:complete
MVVAMEVGPLSMLWVKKKNEKKLKNFLTSLLPFSKVFLVHQIIT